MAIQQIDTQLATNFVIDQLNAQQQTLFELDQLPESTIAFADVTDDVVVGALVLKVFGNTARISLLAVSSEYRGLGIGHNLVDVAIQTSKALNLMHITVNTQDYQAPDFYQSIGFIIFGQLADTPFIGTTKYYLTMTL
ncbi:GNAT family N-acetyltransferase [Weissella confusa]|uniref:GNAT family N-acetyltransferase n=1 Tax=Weissella confusa TaxID=1583 RepID=UPI0022E2902B|nr:GNAT family N-acetyltransferase [Weissella confusa]